MLHLLSKGLNQVSRQKIMLKRKKAHFKSRPISNKKLKEEQQQLNMPYELKKL